MPRVWNVNFGAIDCIAFRDGSEHGQGSFLDVWLRFSIRRSSAIIVVGREREGVEEAAAAHRCDGNTELNQLAVACKQFATMRGLAPSLVG